MTLEQKNLLMYFIEDSKLDKEVDTLQRSILHQISELSKKLPTNEVLDLETDFLDLVALLKHHYFEYGAKAQQVLDDFDLEYQPEILKQTDNKIKQVA